MGIRVCIIYPSQPPFVFPYAVELGFVSSRLPSEFGVNGWRGVIKISRYGLGSPLYSLLFFSGCMIDPLCEFLARLLLLFPTIPPPDEVYYTSRHEGFLDTC